MNNHKFPEKPEIVKRYEDGNLSSSSSFSLKQETQTKYVFTSKRGDYLTPPELVQNILLENDLIYFECDVCCTLYNIPAVVYYKQDGKYVFNKKISNEDGLTGEWYANNWCNPPFDMCDDFVKKAVEEQQKGKTTYMLIPARPETEYWQKYILLNGYANRPNVEIKFFKKGICFLEPETMKPVQMFIKQKDGTFKQKDGVYKNPLALVVFRGI